MEIEQQFREINKIENRLRQLERFYYKKPSPMDMLIEENKTFLQRDYSSRNIYEWNFDNYTDHHIYTMAHRMVMYSTVC